MGPWEEGRECVGACVAWCDLFHVYAASMSDEEEEAFEIFLLGLVMAIHCS